LSFEIAMNHKSSAISYIGIGSNVGDKIDNCLKGIVEIGRINRNKIIAVSSIYKTESIGYTEQEWFVNCVIKIKTDLTPYFLLYYLQDVEKRLGRKRGKIASTSSRWGPRTIDLDILMFNRVIIDDVQFKIPHPRMHERRFVLEPLSEIDENLIHPVIKKSVRTLLDELGTGQRVEPLWSLIKSDI